MKKIIIMFIVLFQLYCSTQYKTKADLPNDTVLFSQSEQFNLKIDDRWQKYPTEFNASLTEKYNSQIDGNSNLIGTEATVIGYFGHKITGYYVAEVKGYDYFLFIPRDKGDSDKLYFFNQKQKKENEIYWENEFKKKRAIKISTKILNKYQSLTTAAYKHYPKPGTKVKVRVMPQQIKLGGKSFEEAHFFSFWGNPVNSELAGYPSPMKYYFIGASMFVTPAIDQFKNDLMEFDIYGKINKYYSQPYITVEYIKLYFSGFDPVLVEVDNKKIDIKKIISN